MRPPVLRLHELVVDSFAGCGGASLGIEWALGRSPDIAVNHDPAAVAMHKANHPTTRHLCGDVWDVDPQGVCGGRPVGLAWFSPDCTFHSKARGKKPIREHGKKVRALAWVVVRWARAVRPRIIILENVEEFADWGPVDNDGYPIEIKRGLTFRIWLGKLKAAGYDVEMRELRAHDYGAPTIRKRLFIIARCDGQPIVWPEPTHGPGRPQPHRTAAECIQWELPTRSIFGRKKPLAEKTMARIARGVQRFVIDAAEPFIVPATHHGDLRSYSLAEPFRTITAAKRGELELIVPTLVQTGYGERPGQAPRSLDLHKPLGTIIAGGTGGNGKHALVAAYLAKHNGGHEATGTRLGSPAPTLTAQDTKALVVAHAVKFTEKSVGQAPDEPLHTVTTARRFGIVASHMLKLRGSCKDGQPWDRPSPTITSEGTHLAEVRAFLMRYNGTGGARSAQLSFGTVTTRDRFGVVVVAGTPYAIVDIGMRMLAPRELFRAQGFQDDYNIAPDLDGKEITKTAQIRMCGNSVCPPLAAALVRVNVAVGNEAAA